MLDEADNEVSALEHICRVPSPASIAVRMLSPSTLEHCALTLTVKASSAAMQEVEHEPLVAKSDGLQSSIVEL